MEHRSEVPEPADTESKPLAGAVRAKSRVTGTLTVTASLKGAVRAKSRVRGALRARRERLGGVREVPRPRPHER